MALESPAILQRKDENRVRFKMIRTNIFLLQTGRKVILDPENREAISETINTVENIKVAC